MNFINNFRAHRSDMLQASATAADKLGESQLANEIRAVKQLNKDMKAFNAEAKYVIKDNKRVGPHKQIPSYRLDEELSILKEQAIRIKLDLSSIGPKHQKAQNISAFKVNSRQLDRIDFNRNQPARSIEPSRLPKGVEKSYLGDGNS
ncbi:hypothetical protein [Vibrio hepatarius]|uniref:hypothetical protein n=1 Tax=Vibrio hepatarius TaxID=171383 RepID=UPI001C080837|nr:hypothetical protein [Vibrio hepatarius]MBU2895474.1 hypothetical protein [Vibrio hepatarius]